MRDGIQMQDNRNPNGIYSITTINPDLVGEIRLILAPVDVELGRGNGSIQYTTRSGTNRFSGSAVWSFRNTALDPNSWTNNRNQTFREPASGILHGASRDTGAGHSPYWTNTHQLTVSYGGPIIRNKTFFFALFDFNRNKLALARKLHRADACARLGIFRYFDTGRNGNINRQNATATGTNATRRVCGPWTGHPMPRCPTGPTGVPCSFRKRLTTTACRPSACSGRCRASRRGRLFGCADQYDHAGAQRRHRQRCSGSWRRLGSVPQAVGPVRIHHQSDGVLSDAEQLRDRRRVEYGGLSVGCAFRGVDNLFGSGEATGDRKQINVKVDHNFTANHKANVT